MSEVFRCCEKEEDWEMEFIKAGDRYFNIKPKAVLWDIGDYDER